MIGLFWFVLFAKLSVCSEFILLDPFLLGYRCSLKYQDVFGCLSIVQNADWSRLTQVVGGKLVL